MTETNKPIKILKGQEVKTRYQEIYRRIAWKLINFRQSEYLNQQQLGEKIGLSRAQVSRMEKGLGDTTLENLLTASEYFKISVEDLFAPEAKDLLEVKPRLERNETSHSGQTRYFASPFKSGTKIKMLTLNAKTHRRIKFDTKLIRDFMVIEGELRIYLHSDFLIQTKNQIFSVKGEGLLRLVNTTERPVVFLMMEG